MKTWNEYYMLVGWRNYCKGKVDYAEEHLNTYKARLYKLGVVIPKLESCVDELDQQRVALKNIPNQANKWTGNNAKKNSERFYPDGDIYREYEDCISSLITRVEDLQNEKNSLYINISDMQGVMDTFSPRYDELYWQVEHYWDE